MRVKKSTFLERGRELHPPGSGQGSGDPTRRSAHVIGHRSGDA